MQAERINGVMYTNLNTDDANKRCSNAGMIHEKIKYISFIKLYINTFYRLPEFDLHNFEFIALEPQWTLSILKAEMLKTVKIWSKNVFHALIH